MSLKIAIPNNKLAESLIQNYNNIKSQYNLNLIEIKEEDILDLLIANKVQIALITPIEYGKAINKLDLRIIPPIALSSISYLGIVDIILKSAIDKIESIIIEPKWNYLGIISYIILKEKYNQHPIQNIYDEKSANNFDTIVTEHNPENGLLNLDISEEWYDLYEIPLPIYFWVCRADNPDKNIEEIIKSLVAQKNLVSNIKEELPSDKNYNPREGKLMFEFNDDFLNSLEFILQNLYYHQFINEIPAIKILGKDNQHLDTNTIKIDKIDI